MAALEDLIKKIDDSNLRRQIEEELRKLKSQKKFGLVFENHNEYTPLYNLPVEINSLVSLKNGEIKSQYIVTDIHGDKATCKNLHSDETLELPIDDLVSIAQFGQPIYPCLKFLDSVSHSPVSMFDNEKNNLWHVLIEAENFYALQLLVYLYEGQVDCIYIDPPYNTGAKDWKYNNDYVDSTDAHRHSKWLSFMDHRLRLAKKLLNPENSVLIVTIDDNELSTLTILLKEIFPERRLFDVHIQHNPRGTQGDFFAVTHETAIFAIAKNSKIYRKIHDADEKDLSNFRKWGNQSERSKEARATTFYPVIVKKSTLEIVGFGDAESFDSPQIFNSRDDLEYVYPIDRNNIERKWRYSRENAEDIKPLLKAVRNKSGAIEIFIARTTENTKTIWTDITYNAETHGTKLVHKILNRDFPFPKSLYAVHDCLWHVVAEKKNALIIDFFAGSGTTLHAVNLLNAEDGGRRRCVLVTNNELSVDEAKKLSAQGYKPGDEEYEKFGIARYVTWPRTVCSIEGHDVNGTPLKGNYIGSDRAMSEGFKSNAIFFKLGFLDRTAVRLGRQFREILSLLWMKAGCYGECPVIDENQEVPEILILPENHMAVLNDNAFYSEFAARLEHEANIETVFLVTDSESDFRAMAKGLNAKNKIQLYRDYLENFRLDSKTPTP